MSFCRNDLHDKVNNHITKQNRRSEAHAIWIWRVSYCEAHFKSPVHVIYTSEYEIHKKVCRILGENSLRYF